jgi:hypothetical protein
VQAPAARREFPERRSHIRTLSLLFLGAALVACAPAPQEVREEPATEPTPAAAALPEGATVVLDGPYATVTRFDLQPGQAQSVHEGPNRVIYSLNDYTLEWTEGSGGRSSVQKRSLSSILGLKTSFAVHSRQGPSPTPRSRRGHLGHTGE